MGEPRLPEPKVRRLGYMYVRLCRGIHYHITTGIGDLSYGPFATDDEAWAMVEQVNRNDQEREATRNEQG